MLVSCYVIHLTFFYFHIIIVQYIFSGVHTEQRSQLITLQPNLLEKIVTLPPNLLVKIDTLPPNLLEKIDTTLQLDGPPFTANEISENGIIFFYKNLYIF